MISFENKRKNARLESFVTASIEDSTDRLTVRCKFNFHYMDFSQPAGQKFNEWNKDQLVKLFDKLKNYSAEPLKYWLTQSQRVGHRSHNVLEIYGNFPAKSEFQHPKHVPHQVQWARFRVENLVRLIGFVIPKEFSVKIHSETKSTFDCNTFYAVFLDKDHKFYRK
ncbi:MAG: hypothetical protein V1782_04905 [Pseudomonadota bacterium]